MLVRIVPAATPGQRIARFVLVGCVAAAVHWTVVVALVDQGAWRPLVANVAGWLVAFGVSFLGHHRLTFAGHDAPVRRAVHRFLWVSAAGFAINEAAYAWLLSATTQRYDVLLALVLLAVATFTYLLGRRWAFQGSRAP